MYESKHNNNKTADAKLFCRFESKGVRVERIIEKLPNDLEALPEETFWKTLTKLRQKPGSKYKYIVNGGYSLQVSLL